MNDGPRKRKRKRKCSTRHIDNSDDRKVASYTTVVVVPLESDTSIAVGSHMTVAVVPDMTVAVAADMMVVVALDMFVVPIDMVVVVGVGVVVVGVGSVGVAGIVVGLIVLADNAFDGARTVGIQNCSCRGFLLFLEAPLPSVRFLHSNPSFHSSISLFHPFVGQP